MTSLHLYIIHTQNSPRTLLGSVSAFPTIGSPTLDPTSEIFPRVVPETTLEGAPREGNHASPLANVYISIG